MAHGMSSFDLPGCMLLLNLFLGDYLLSQIDNTEAHWDCLGRSPPLPKARKITHPKGASCHELLTSPSWSGKPDCFASVCGNPAGCPKTHNIVVFIVCLYEYLLSKIIC